MAIIGQKYRTQILFEPEQHQALTEISQREGRSVSELVREIIQAHLDEQETEAEFQMRMEALERITMHRAKILARREGKPLTVDVVELIHQMREERVEAILNAGSNERD